MLAILILADQFAYMLATGTLTALRNLLVDESLECIGQGNIHRAHGAIVGRLAKVGKAGSLSRPTTIASAFCEYRYAVVR